MSKGWGDNGSSRGWRKIRLRRLEIDGYVCQLKLAGCTYRATHVHHVAQWTGRPEDTPLDLLRAACAHCNLMLGDRGFDSDPEPRPWSRSQTS